MARILGLEIDCDDSGCYTDVEFYGNMDVYEILKASGAKPSELDDRLILIYEKKISSVSAVVKALELALKRQRPLLIVAEDVDSEALATLILNKLRSGIKICAVKAPGFVENRKAGLQDLATLIGEESVLKSAAAYMMGALSALRSMMSKSV